MVLSSLICSNEEKALEDTLVLVKLLSLVGVNAIYCHQWRDTVSNGINRLKTLIKGIGEILSESILYVLREFYMKCFLRTYFMYIG